MDLAGVWRISLVAKLGALDKLLPWPIFPSYLDRCLGLHTDCERCRHVLGGKEEDQDAQDGVFVELIGHVYWLGCLESPLAGGRRAGHPQRRSSEPAADQAFRFAFK